MSAVGNVFLDFGRLSVERVSIVNHQVTQVIIYLHTLGGFIPKGSKQNSTSQAPSSVCPNVTRLYVMNRSR